METTEPDKAVVWAQTPYFGDVDTAETISRGEACARYGPCTVVNVEAVLALNSGKVFVCLHYHEFQVMVGDLKTMSGISTQIQLHLERQANHGAEITPSDAENGGSDRLRDSDTDAGRPAREV